METCVLTVIGDGIVGKTCLLMRYVNNVEPDEDAYVPTIFENYSANVKLDDGREVNLQIWDTAGQEDYEKLRILSYKKTTIFLLCYAVNLSTSLKNCQDRWVPELKNHTKSPIILIGTKADLLKDEESRQKALWAGQKMAKQIKAKKFFLTSSITGEGIQEAIKAAIVKGLPKSNKCLLF